MGFTDDLALASLEGKPCIVARFVNRQPDADDIRAACFALNGETLAYDHSHFARALKARGYEGSIHMVRRHRVGECACPPS